MKEITGRIESGSWKINWPDILNVVNKPDWNFLSALQLALSFMKDGPTMRMLYVYHDNVAEIPEGKAIEITIRIIDEDEVVK